jgi:predicted NBD/HSP70 family sugar kinase
MASPGMTTPDLVGPSGLASRPAARAPARQKLLKRHNLALVLREIAHGENLTRAQVAARTGLTKATVSALVEVLREARLVIEGDPAKGMLGRPGSPLRLNPRGPVGLGIEINVDYVSSCLVDLTGEMHFRYATTSDNRQLDARAILVSAVSNARRTCSEAEAAGLHIAGMGIAVPGLVDYNGVLLKAPNVVALQNVPVAELVSEMLGIEFQERHCDNEANLAALAELWFRQDLGLQNFVRVSGEIGVGAGIVVGGSLLRGVRGLAGEIGHVVVDPYGRACGCGGRGCLEQIAGQEALLRAAHLTDQPPATLHGTAEGPAAQLRRQAELGNETTLSALTHAGRGIGVALSALLNIIDVPTVVLGGLYADLAPWLLQPITTELHTRALTHTTATPVDVRISTLGTDASLRGAAARTIQSILDDPAPWSPGALNLVQ